MFKLSYTFALLPLLQQWRGHYIRRDAIFKLDKIRQGEHSNKIEDVRIVPNVKNSWVTDLFCNLNHFLALIHHSNKFHKDQLLLASNNKMSMTCSRAFKNFIESFLLEIKAAISFCICIDSIFVWRPRRCGVTFFLLSTLPSHKEGVSEH